jgi:uncharacterized protein YwgA
MLRNWSEVLLDRFLTLFLVRETIKSGWPITGKLKLLKLIYLAEQRMTKEGIKGFNYNFYRWDYGPFSHELIKDYEYLVDNGFLKESNHNIDLTERGLGVLEDCRELLDKNGEIIDYIRKVIKEFGPYRGKKIKKVVYDIPKIEEKKLISETLHGEELLRRMEADEAKKFFLIDDEWLETIAILMDKELSNSLERGLKDAKEGKIKRYALLQG